MQARGRSLDIIIPEGLRERHWHGYRATIAIGRRWPMTSLLDMLKEADLRIGFTNAFRRIGQSRYDDGEILSVPAVRKDGNQVSVEFTTVPFADDAGRMMALSLCAVSGIGVRNLRPLLLLDRQDVRTSVAPL
jgi:hypothetical protein